MTDRKIKPGTPEGFLKIKIPTSKSFANRALMIAAVAKEDITIENIAPSTDVKTMISILKTIGLSIEEKNYTLKIRDSFPQCEKTIRDKSTIVFAGDGGTTSRFITALLSLGEKEYKVVLEGHMKKRPMEGILAILESLGVKAQKQEDASILINGPSHVEKSFSKQLI